MWGYLYDDFTIHQDMPWRKGAQQKSKRKVWKETRRSGKHKAKKYM